MKKLRLDLDRLCIHSFETEVAGVAVMEAASERTRPPICRETFVDPNLTIPVY